MSHGAAARACGVRPRIILWWIETGVWPLPRDTRGSLRYFNSQDIFSWIEKGEWPNGSLFRRPGRTGSHRSTTGLS
ncbi:MerR family transcriptional regulator [Singulisphaera sp. PoT]|uniref:MerR family transcriptional regulator n=1 Tax=Singulisphaera sp. PoT TaxID=3411797 RepID=UPI003BF592D9